MKCPGPDGTAGRSLKFCADHSGVLGHPFQASHFVPCLWKMSAIIPIPKSLLPNNLMISASVPLASLKTKNLKKIEKSFILFAVEPTLDPLQFAYRAGTDAEDAKLFIFGSDI